MIKIAIPYVDGEIGEHFGHAGMFAVYEANTETEKVESKKLVDASELHGHQQMADLMKAEGVDVLICGNLGAEARALLLQYSILPFAGYCGDADTAADMLIEGRLPMMPEGAGACGGGCGGCGGSCGGCGGGCGSDDDDGGCGCGCGCH